MGDNDRVPVLIIPGFMSSGLVCKKSGVGSKFVDKRVWLNLGQIGFQSLHSDGAVVKNEKKKRDHDQGVQGVEYSQALHVEYEEAYRCKSAWLQHMALKDDMFTERGGNQLRAIPGLDGVEFLSDDSMTQLGTYVFGPTTAALQKMGYIRGLDLDAAPYDWRLPPSLTEERDKYHTRTIERIEKMYSDNKNKAVALLCHSLGCKMGHFFLNHCHHVKGREWIDKHIHAYIPVGGPHLGVSKAVRAIVSGDKMALDAFLSDEEGLILGRSLGSGPWMVSTKLPADVAAIPNVICRKEGTLTITIGSVNMKPLVSRRTQPSSLRLCIEYGKEAVCTDIMNFNETFRFAAPPSLNNARERLLIYLQEPGTRSAQSRDKRSCVGHVANCICCPVKWCCLFPCTIVANTLKVGWLATRATASAAAGAFGVGSGFATSMILDPHRALKKSGSTYKGQKTVQFTAQSDAENPPLFRSKRQSQAIAQIEWTPPPATTGGNVDSGSALAILPDPKQKTFGPLLQVKDPKNEHAGFEPVSGFALIQAEGIEEKLFELLKNRYEMDPLGPRTKSSRDAPPVKRVISIYGINRPTEVSGIYRRRPARIVRQGAPKESTYILDSKARLAPTDKASRSYQVSGGIIYETKSTPQVMNKPDGAPAVRFASGDGTVPFWSLQHSRSWASPTCVVKVHEIEGAEHREILADKRFHEILREHLVTTTKSD